MSNRNIVSIQRQFPVLSLITEAKERLATDQASDAEILADLEEALTQHFTEQIQSSILKENRQQDHLTGELGYDKIDDPFFLFQELGLKISFDLITTIIYRNHVLLHDFDNPKLVHVDEMREEDQ